MNPSNALAADLVGLDLEGIEPVSAGSVYLEVVDMGHAMTEVGASWSPSGNHCCSCCVGCCCCCC